MKPIESFIVELRSQKVILDSDIAKIYGVETRDINKAVKNNSDKFPHIFLKYPKKNFCGGIFFKNSCIFFAAFCGLKVRLQNIFIINHHLRFRNFHFFCLTPKHNLKETYLNFFKFYIHN